MSLLLRLQNPLTVLLLDDPYLCSWRAYTFPVLGLVDVLMALPLDGVDYYSTFVPTSHLKCVPIPDGPGMGWP